MIYIFIIPLRKYSHTVTQFSILLVFVYQLNYLLISSVRHFLAHKTYSALSGGHTYAL